MRKKTGNIFSSVLLTVLLMMSVPSLVLAQKGVEIKISKNEVAPGETVELTYSFTNVNVGSFRPPAFDGFDVSGPMTSSQISVVNGEASSAKTVTYILVARKPGNYSFKGADVVLDGKKTKTAGFMLTVSGSNSSQNGAPNISSQGNSAKRNWQDDIFIVAEPDKKSAYVGEQIVLEYQLWTRLEYMPDEIIKNPVYNGFLMEEMKVPNGKSGQIKERNGYQYSVIPLKKIALFASQPGKKTIPALTLRGTVFLKVEEDLFPGVLINRTEPKVVDLSTKAFTVEVKPLPEPPSDFSGGVGNFEVFSVYDRTNLSAGEALHLRMKIEGSGNIKMIQIPALNVPTDIEVFDPKMNENIDVNGYMVKGYKESEWVIVPEEEGDFKIPAFGISFFDPETGTYYRKEIDEHPLTVRGKALQPYSPPLIQQLKGKLKTNNRDNLGIKEANISVWWYVGGVGFFVMSLAMIALLFSRKNIAEPKNTPSSDQEDVFSKWTKLAAEGKEKEALSGLLQWLKYEVIIQWSEQLDDERKAKLQHLMQQCEQSIYTPSMIVSASTAIEKAREILKDLLHSIHQTKAS